jgi:hypothetical protein
MPLTLCPDAVKTAAIERPTTPPPAAARLTRRQLAKQEEELREAQCAPSPEQPSELVPATEDVAQSHTGSMQEDPAAIEPSEDAAPGAEEDSPLEGQAEEELDSEDIPQEEVAEETVGPEQSLAPVDENEALEEVSTGVSEAEDVETQKTSAPMIKEGQQDEPVEQESGAVPTLENTQTEPDSIAPSVEITSEPEPKTLAAERPSEAARTPSVSRTSSRRASRSPSKSPMRIEESIEALDALEEALEDVGKAVSHFDQSTEEPSPRKRAFPNGATTPSAKAPRKTPLASRVSRAPSAAPQSIKPMKSLLARASSVRVASAKEIRKPSETTDYLASKRRPISVSFPTPPPPPKGRAPTRATFQLSSDAVAEKLKTQKEERLKREAQREADGVPLKTRPISMPPVAKSTKAPTKATFVLPGEAIAAKLRAQKEDRLKREADNASGQHPKARPVSVSMPPPTVKSTKPVTKATFQLSSEATTAKLRAQKEERQKREEEAAEAARKATTSKSRPLSMRKPVTLPTRTQPGISIPPPPQPKPDNTLHPPVPLRSTSLTSKRTSIHAPSQSRSTSTSSTTPSNRASMLVAPPKVSGRDVFNRDRNEKDAKDRERREKEDAAKMARAQAAERGRVASREWAERQRKKMVEAVRGKANAA